VNYSDTEVALRVYAGAGATSPEGLFDIGLGAEDHASAWVGLAFASTGEPIQPGDVLTMPAQSAVEIAVQLTVPTDATPGDHPFGVVAELVSAADDDWAMATRVGVRVHLRVDGPTVARQAIEELATRYNLSWNPFAPGELYVTFELINEGNVRSTVDAQVTVEGPWGLGASTTTIEQHELLPGQSQSVETTLSFWPLLLGTATIAVEPGPVGDDEPAQTTEPVVEELAVTAVPLAHLSVIAAAVLLALCWRQLRRRHRQRLEARVASLVERRLSERQPRLEGAAPGDLSGDDRPRALPPDLGHGV